MVSSAPLYVRAIMGNDSNYRIIAARAYKRPKPLKQSLFKTAEI